MKTILTWRKCRKEKKAQTCKVSLQWFNNKHVVPTLQSMKKMVTFHHKDCIDMLKFGCTFPNIANICLLRSTSAKFYPFTESDIDLLEKICDDMVSGCLILFTRKNKVLVDEALICKSLNVCNLIVGIDAIQTYPCSTCQPMPTRFLY